MTQCALQASATLAAAQERVEQLAAIVATLVAAPLALRAAVDALHGTLLQPGAEAVPHRAPQSTLSRTRQCRTAWPLAFCFMTLPAVN